MKRLLAFFIAAVFSTSLTFAADPKVEVAIAKDPDTKPTDVFPADVPQLHAFFKTDGTKKGDALRGAWIAEDVGEVAPKETKIAETTVTGDRDNFFGAFSLSKPTKGWPVGKYRVEVYAGDKVVGTAKFTVK
jgi:hypothetical protein